ncbi:MAG: hypothetical protein H7245_13710, partial [Candidatus Saccharibacteria bacterium]|nr:hypothetical protein [Pseudorhodobacter sp.]
MFPGEIARIVQRKFPAIQFIVIAVCSMQHKPFVLFKTSLSQAMPKEKIRVVPSQSCIKIDDRKRKIPVRKDCSYGRSGVKRPVRHQPGLKQLINLVAGQGLHHVKQAQPFGHGCGVVDKTQLCLSPGMTTVNPVVIKPPQQ